MAIDQLDPEPRSHAVEGIVGEIWCGYLGQQPGVEGARARPDEAGAFAFPLEHGEIEPQRVPDEHAAVGEGRKLWPHLGERRRTRHRGVIDAVDARRRGGDRNGRAHPSSQRDAGLQPPAGESHGRDLDQPRPTRIEARRLDVDRHRVEGDERRGAAALSHRLLHRLDLR
jgi:hypothetical protein